METDVIREARGEKLLCLAADIANIIEKQGIASIWRVFNTQMYRHCTKAEYKAAVKLLVDTGLIREEEHGIVSWVG